MARGDRSTPGQPTGIGPVSGFGSLRGNRATQPVAEVQATAELSARRDIPPPESENFSEKVREALSTFLGKRGDPLDRAVTLRDLVTAGMVNLAEGYKQNPSGFDPISGPGQTLIDLANTYVVDLTPPPTPTGFAATAAVNSIIVTHDAPDYTQGNGHARTRLYGASYTTGPLPTFSETLLLAEFTGAVYSHPVNPGQNWRLWIKWVTNDGVMSTTPAGGVNGVSVTSAYDPATIIAALTGVYGGGQPYYYISSATTINGVAVPVGTYINDLWVANGTITNAKIANLAVDDAKISSLNVSKLVAGTLAVGQYIQSVGYLPGTSGWRINANGTAEFSAASIRGQLTASQIDSRGLSIKDAFGNVIFAAGTPLAASNITPDAGWLNGNISIGTDGNINGIGSGSGQSVANNTDTFVRSPSGGTSLNNVGGMTGAIKIRLPVGIANPSMPLFFVDIMEYAAGYSCSIQISGHNWNDGNWYNESAYIVGASNVEYPVRFGFDSGGRYCVYIGSPSDVWEYPQIRVRDISIGYGSQNRDLWSSGWAISFVTSFEGVSRTVLDTKPGANWGKTTGSGKPQDNATVGATFGVNIGGQITPTNASTFIADAAIQSAQIADAAIGTAKIENAAVTTALIADAAITTAKIGDAQISTAKIADAAISSAKIGDAQVLTAKIGDLQVNTVKLANQAVTIPSSAYTAANASFASPNTWVAVQTVSFTSTGAPVYVSGLLTASTRTATANSGNSWIEARITRNGSLIYESKGVSAYTNVDIACTISCAVSDTPGAISVTYVLEARVTGSNPGTAASIVSQRSLFALETKK